MNGFILFVATQAFRTDLHGTADDEFGCHLFRLSSDPRQGTAGSFKPEERQFASRGSFFLAKELSDEDLGVL